MLEYVNKNSRRPRLLEVGLLCETFHTHPGVYGFDPMDPRVMRTVDLLLDVYHAAVSRRQAKKKIEWDKKHHAESELLRWAKRGEASPLPISSSAGETIAHITIPERPKDW